MSESFIPTLSLKGDQRITRLSRLVSFAFDEFAHELGDFVVGHDLSLLLLFLLLILLLLLLLLQDAPSYPPLFSLLLLLLCHRIRSIYTYDLIVTPTTTTTIAFSDAEFLGFKLPSPPR